MDGHFSCFYSLWPIIQGLIVAMQGVFVILPFLVFIVLYVPLLYICHHQYCLLQVEGDSSEDELHVPFLGVSIAHPGETIPSLQKCQYLFNPIAHTADQPVRKTLDEGKRFASLPPCA